VMESERAERLARFDADDARAKLPKVPLISKGNSCEGCKPGECNDQECPNYIAF
jgi:hypothetical protein